MKRAVGVLLVVLCPLTALALQQPDGTVIPVGPGLQGMFDARGEAIDAIADAATTPETYVPGCALTFEVVQRNAGFQNSFGWYNVTGSPPTVADLHEFLLCTDGVGTVKVLDIRNDPAYAGGEIGFYEATGACATLATHDNLFFSQPAFNPDSGGPNPTIHMITYNSTVTPNAFYFAWEDLLAGGDNDFDDLTTFVTGITCSGGGGPCDTGQAGVCADGTLQCQAGVLECVPSNVPSDEVCDGLDNNCDGVVDEAAPCPGSEICDRGQCVPPCGSGEFPCDPGEVCDNDVCVDPDCVSVECPPGQICDGDGNCVGACDGVVCPYGQVCRVGQCVDPCATLTCDADQVCELGVCVATCDCSACASGETCQTDGHCIADTCVGNSCTATQHCVDGTCVDNCDGAVCPDGEICESGECVTAPTPEIDAGVPDVPDAGTGPAPDGGGGNNGDGGGGGCCGTTTDPRGALVLILGVAFLVRRRRRR